jgi:TrmH family RNA methyltransferase
VIRKPGLELGGLSVENFRWGVALLAPQDPGNIGSILRTIDAVGASGLLLLDDPANNQYCADPYHPSSVRASMGSVFWYPVVSTTFTRFVSWVTADDYHVYGTSAHATEDYHTISQYMPPLILLMGSERAGLTASQATVCDELVSIPMQGRVTSLNLAIASGIMLYEILNKL